MKRPMIGITAHVQKARLRGSGLYLSSWYARAVYEAGGVPVVLPVLDLRYTVEITGQIQGLLISGGGGIGARYFTENPYPSLRETNPVRYEFEQELIRTALHLGLPVLGICRGMQMLNEVAGGHLIKNIALEVQGALDHYQRLPGWKATHAIFLDKRSLLSDILGVQHTEVNSFHRQAIANVGRGLNVVARAEDGVVEAIERTGSGFVIGVQFHPEMLFERHTLWLKLFKAFVSAAERIRI
ncbi:MAG: gamma-glutamyl-gamma-aminobutyrate hydrolase family protein [Candidatus Methanomethylicaceae archaeon]